MRRTTFESWFDDFSYQPASFQLRLSPKLACDVLLSLLALVIMAPFLLLVVLAIKLESKGPALFSQTRYGWDNGPFRIYKVRPIWPQMADASGVKQTQENDPRVTPLGAQLRRDHIVFLMREQI